VLRDHFGVTGRFVLVETLTPAPERLSGEILDSGGERGISGQFVLKVDSELLDAPLSAVVLQGVWVSEPATVSNAGIQQVSTVRPTASVHVGLVGLAVADARLLSTVRRVISRH
jgi:hypothetical protein